MRARSHRLRAVTALAVALALASAGVAVPARPAGAQTFSETTEVVVIEVPVQVIDDGQPVRGLTRENFEVFDGRKKQEITGFEVLDLYGTATPARPPEVPSSARRHFLLLFDLAFSEPKNMVRARDAAKDLVEGLHPTDLVAVATYSASRGPQLALGFTRDRYQIGKAIETLGVPELRDRSPDPLGLMYAEALDARNQAQSRQGGSENRAAAEEQLLENLEELSVISRRADRNAQQNAVTSFTRSIADLAKLLGNVQGRKHVVYLSEGFDSSLLTGTTDDAQRAHAAAAAQSGQIWNSDSEDLFGSTKSLNQVESMLEELRRADAVVQSVDVGGLRGSGDLAPQRGGGKDTLFQFARSTGGELYENFNDLSAAMDQMLQRTGVTYVLAFQPDKLKLDGSYHRLRVELKNVPRGTRVTHRPGYYAPRPFSEQAPLERLLQTANRVASGDEGGTVATSVLAAPFRTSAEKAYVPVLVEVDGASLLAGKMEGTAAPIEIYVYAMDESGAVHDFLTQTLGIDLTKNAAALKQSGLKFFGHVELLPGRYSVRVLVRNGLTGASGLRVVPVEVPAQSQALLLPPLFPEPPDRWVIVREAPRGEQQNAPYPFIAREQPYIPSSKPRIAPEQEMALSLIGYNLPAGELSADSKILGTNGKEVGNGRIQIQGRESGSGGLARLIGTFRAPKLQPGEYLLEVTVKAADGTAQTSTTPFVVGG
jgi:VWFA-related protein